MSGQKAWLCVSSYTGEGAAGPPGERAEQRAGGGGGRERHRGGQAAGHLQGAPCSDALPVLLDRRAGLDPCRTVKACATRAVHTRACGPLAAPVPPSALHAGRTAAHARRRRRAPALRSTVARLCWVTQQSGSGSKQCMQPADRRGRLSSGCLRAGRRGGAHPAGGGARQHGARRGAVHRRRPQRRGHVHRHRARRRHAAPARRGGGFPSVRAPLSKSHALPAAELYQMLAPTAGGDHAVDCLPSCMNDDGWDGCCAVAVRAHAHRLVVAVRALASGGLARAGVCMHGRPEAQQGAAVRERHGRGGQHPGAASTVVQPWRRAGVSDRTRERGAREDVAAARSPASPSWVACVHVMGSLPRGIAERLLERARTTLGLSVERLLRPSSLPVGSVCVHGMSVTTRCRCRLTRQAVSAVGLKDSLAPNKAQGDSAAIACRSAMCRLRPCHTMHNPC